VCAAETLCLCYTRPSCHSYDPQFLGMLEDPADGLGCWTIQGSADMTLVGLVSSFLVCVWGGGGGTCERVVRPARPGAP
jgi:hypothetical protein